MAELEVHIFMSLGYWIKGGDKFKLHIKFGKLMSIAMSLPTSSSFYNLTFYISSRGKKASMDCRKKVEYIGLMYISSLGRQDLVTQFL